MRIFLNEEIGVRALYNDKIFQTGQALFHPPLPISYDLRALKSIRQLDR